ncbi:NAC domain-containing protein 54-like isoform X1 [Lycium ferocissimum]|uniref:NAC domain-containing protein 54-like isoform X1 n=1 Tax=Lycium ferocissimum TaxID=112874 RepID=UPI0028165262|nr:NAC domain-containing protein 54-like isoform X1 [Lycium ferocissimum]
MAPVSLPPGFRFHPTDEELVVYYLKRKINAKKIELEIIRDVDLYKCEPWDLPGKSLLPSKDLEWYFFSPRDRKYPNGSRTNRATKAGYWKATGKDRKVNSQMRPVGMKKTLVYYKGRAPHGARTDWVMHEYRLDERECEVANGLQDAYALCRIIKKSLNGPKIGDHYGRATSDRSSSIDHVYSEGRYDHHDMESSHHEYGLMPSSSPATSMAVHGSPMNMNNIGSASSDDKWMQYLSNEAFSYNNSSQPIPSYGTLPFPPPKVDIALECARLQHRFTLPPLEIQDFPQVGYVDAKIPQSNFIHQTSNQTQLASQNLINQDSWGGNSSGPVDDFSFLIPPNNNQIPHDLDSLNFMEQLKEDQNVIRSIDIGDFDHEDFKSARMVENLRWIGMSDRDLEKTFLEGYKTVPIENVSAVQKEEYELQGENSGHNSFNGFNETATNNFSIGFDNSANDNSLYDGDTDGFSNSPSFEVYEKIEVNHGFFIATRQATKTFYHHVAPSRTLRIHRNLVTVHDFPIYNIEKSDSKSTITKDKTFLDNFVTRPWTTTMRTLVGMVAILQTFWVYIGECLESEEKGFKLEDKKGVYEEYCLVEKEEKKKVQDFKWDFHKQNEFPIGDKEEGKYCNVGVEKKWPNYLTLVVALSSIWLHHIIVPSF